MGSNWLPAPVMRTKDPSCLEEPTEHLTLTSENNQENRNNIVLLWLAASATLRKEFENNKLGITPQSGSCGEVSYF